MWMKGMRARLKCKTSVGTNRQCWRAEAAFIPRTAQCLKCKINGHAANGTKPEGEVDIFRVKASLAKMLNSGVITDVVTPVQARLAELAVAVAMRALERDASSW